MIVPKIIINLIYSTSIMEVNQETGIFATEFI